MRITGPFVLGVLAGTFAMGMTLRAATYVVALDGDDARPGTQEMPWRTIQFAAGKAQPGDTVIVRGGVFDERVATVRGGTAATNRIVFFGNGTVTMKGFSVNHPFITVDGFDIARHSHPNPFEAWVRIGQNGDNLEVLNCTFRDGIGIALRDAVFVAPNLIRSASGGFLAAGFAAGQSISVLRATNITVANNRSFVIDRLDDTTLTVGGSLVVDEGPKPAYITASVNYGLHFHSGSENCVFRGNVFRNLSYIFWFIAGTNHLFENNLLEHNNGWDLTFFAGVDHVMRSNVFRDGGWGAFQPSADVFDNLNAKYERIVFTNNWVQNFIGVINAQKFNTTVSGPILVTRNVFIDVGDLRFVMPNSQVVNNTFLRVARASSVAVQLNRHALYFEAGNYATNGLIRNNIFVDCGEVQFGYTDAERGWYQINGPASSIVAEGNFVSGSQPGYGPKIGFPEPNPSLNGGDPGFVDIYDPLGPDGVPFTADDGVRLRLDSKLRGAGVGGVDIGAYEAFVQPPSLVASWLVDGSIRLTWPSSAKGFSLQSAPGVTGPWMRVGVAPAVEGDRNVVALRANGQMEFYRLAQ